MIYLIIKNNYVVNRVVGEPKRHEGDFVLPDTDQNIHIGDWYEESEDVFYRPVTKPNDLNLPESIAHIWDKQNAEEDAKA